MAEKKDDVLRRSIRRMHNLLSITSRLDEKLKTLVVREKNASVALGAILDYVQKTASKLLTGELASSEEVETDLRDIEIITIDMRRRTHERRQYSLQLERRVDYVQSRLSKIMDTLDQYFADKK